jgi:O-antigen/teichoic acid export membrane protein
MRRLSVSFLQLAASSLAGQAIGFAVLVVVARRIGPTDLGAFALASSIAAYFTLPISGIAMLSIRDIAHDKAKAPHIVGIVLPTLGCFAISASALIYILAPQIAPTPVVATMLRIFAVSTLVTTVTLDWALQGLQVFKSLALVRFIGQVLYGVAACFLVTSGLEGAYRYAWLTVFGLTVTLAGTWVYTARTIGWPSFRLNLGHSIELMRHSAAFTVSVVMIQLYYTADFVLLGFLSRSHNVGEYLVAYKVPLFFLGLASLWITVFYPHAATQERQALSRQIGIFTTLSIVLVMPLCAGSFVLGGPLITTLFGPHYEPAGLYFKLLMLAVGCAAIDANIGQILLATGHERTFALGVGLGALANIALNLALIPSIGPAGSAIATIVAEAVVLTFMAVRLRTTLGMPRVLWSRVVGAAFSSLVMVLMLKSVFAAWPVLPRIAWGILVYLVAAVVTRTVRPSDDRRVYRAAAS